MFRLFKSKDLSEKDARVPEIGRMLFQQISLVRDKANVGQINKNLVSRGLILILPIIFFSQIFPFRL
jgi:hypothetical protein